MILTMVYRGLALMPLADLAAADALGAPISSVAAGATASVVPLPLLMCAQHARCHPSAGESDLDRNACSAHCAAFRSPLFAHAPLRVGQPPEGAVARCLCYDACSAVLSDPDYSLFTSGDACPARATLPNPPPTSSAVAAEAVALHEADNTRSRIHQGSPAAEPGSARASSPSLLSSRWHAGMSAGAGVLLALNLLHIGCFIVMGTVWFATGLRRARAVRSLPVMIERAQRAFATPPPPLCVVLPVKGAHAQSAANWRAQLLCHGYSGKISFTFVVQEETDPAYVLLKQLQAQGRLPTEGVSVLVAGLATRNSQKLHNMIYAIERVGAPAELVLMLDDDMLMAPGATDLLAHELLSDPSALAASGFSCDVPAHASVACHAASIFRLFPEVSFSTGGANAAWGGCMMLRRADLLESVPHGVMQAWKNCGYSDDWIINQVARRQGRRIANPPLLFLNLCEFNSLKSLYNFLHRQFFVLDTYVEPPPGAATGPWSEPHRRESYLLSAALGLVGGIFALAPPLLVAQAVRLLAVPFGATEAWADRLLAPETIALLAVWLLAVPITLAGGAAAARAQHANVAALSPDAGETLRAEGRWSVFLAPLGFFLFCALAPAFTFQGILGSSVVWSGVRYHKRHGRVAKMERIVPPMTSAGPSALAAAPAPPDEALAHAPVAAPMSLAATLLVDGGYDSAEACAAVSGPCHRRSNSLNSVSIRS